MKTTAIACVLGLLALTGCNPPIVKSPSFHPTVQFNPANAEYALIPGDGAITGQAFMRLDSGRVVTCAGETVWLVPVTPYETERMMWLYRSMDQGVNWYSDPRFVPRKNPAIAKFERSTVCDVQGKFGFHAIPPGQYYLVASVTWGTSGGGWLMKRMTVENGRTDQIVLAD